VSMASNDPTDPLSAFHSTSPRRPFEPPEAGFGVGSAANVHGAPDDDSSRPEDSFTPTWASERPSFDHVQGTARAGELHEAGDVLSVKIRIIRILRSRGDVSKHVPAILELLHTSTTNLRRKRHLHLEMAEQAKRYCLPADVTAKLECTVPGVDG
jgi:hypothetical protein